MADFSCFIPSIELVGKHEILATQWSRQRVLIANQEKLMSREMKKCSERTTGKQ